MRLSIDLICETVVRRSVDVVICLFYRFYSSTGDAKLTYLQKMIVLFWPNSASRTVVVHDPGKEFALHQPLTTSTKSAPVCNLQDAYCEIRPCLVYIGIKPQKNDWRWSSEIWILNDIADLSPVTPFEFLAVYMRLLPIMLCDAETRGGNERGDSARTKVSGLDTVLADRAMMASKCSSQILKSTCGDDTSFPNVWNQFQGDI